MLLWQATEPQTRHASCGGQVMPFIGRPLNLCADEKSSRGRWRD